MTLADIRLKDVRKALVAVVTLVSLALTQGLVPDPYATWATLGIAFANVYGIYAVRNGDKVVEPGHDHGAEEDPFL